MFTNLHSFSNAMALHEDNNWNKYEGVDIITAITW
jgi:hypothetical protein